MFFTVMAIGITGCKKFLDVNKNPNNPTDESVTPNLILSSALKRIADRTATSYGSTARWMGYWTRSGTYGPNTEEESYHITTTFEANEWTGWYDILNDLDVMEKKSQETGQDFYLGAAKMLKTVGFMYLVDQYNNVPYTEAFDLNSKILPKYDKGSDIYNDLFLQLDSALAAFKRVENVSGENEEFDIMFGGDVEEWIKLINTQRLKLALRLANVSGFNASGQMSKVSSEGFLTETAYIQPGYAKDLDKQNPFWNAYKELYTGDVADNFNRANNYVLGKYRSNSDQRYTRVFSPVASSCSDCNPPVSAGSYFGYDYGEVNDDPDQPKAANSSNVAGPALAESPEQPQWFFTSVESKFLQAEAIARGWIAGTAQTIYREAVTESFVWLGLTAAEATTYLDQTVAIVTWPAGNADQIKTILMQKYLALTGINNFEPWVDYRRTGVPSDLPMSLSPSRGGYIIPLRLMYPQDEYNYNPQAVAAEGNIDPQKNKIFWDVN